MEASSHPRPPAQARGLLIVEDDRLLRERLLAATRSAQDWTAYAAGDAVTARRLFAQNRIDAVFLDLGLPDADGVDLITEFRRANPACEILVITVFAEETRVVRSLEAGASGYILKSDLADYAGRLVSFIETGGSPISPAIARSLINRLRPPASGDRSADNPLSQREAEVLSLCAKGLRYSEIADVLGVSTHTVNAHLKNVYRKLMVRSRSEAVFEARRSGILND